MRGTAGLAGELTHRLGVEIGLRHNGAFYYASEDRSILENLIIPYFQLSPEHRRILFVGTAWHTAGYARMFDRKEFSTIDANPASERYGASHHVIDEMASLRRYFQAESLDLVMCNGVVGWGLDDSGDAEAAFAAAVACLRPGGVLMIGWNDLDEHRPFRLGELPSIAALEPWVLPPLESSRYLVDNAWRHVFSFYRKPD